MNDGVNEVGAESAPMRSGGFIKDNGGLTIAERLRLIQTCGILSHVDNSVLNALGIESAVGGVALNTGGLGEDNDHE